MTVKTHEETNKIHLAFMKDLNDKSNKKRLMDVFMTLYL